MMLLKNLFIMTIFVILAGCGGGGGGSTNAVGEGELNSDSWRLFNRITPISVHDFEFNKYFDNLAKVYDNSICKGTFSYKGEGSVSCYDRLTLSHIFTAKNNDMWAAEFTIVNDSLYTVGGDSVFRLHAYSLSGSNATLENSFQIEGSRYTNNVHAIIAYDSDRKLAVLTATNVYKYDISGGADSINLIESLNFDPGHASAKC